MLFSGAHARANDLVIGYQSILNMLAAKQYKVAALEIAQYQGSHFASIILKEIIKHQNPDCWLAFLSNPYLQHEMDCNSLRAMINPAQKAVRYGGNAILKQPAFRDIAVTIAQNPAWCQMLSYRFFIDSVPFDQKLENYIVNSPDFIRCLEAYHLSLLMDKCPNQVANILVTIAEFTQGNHFDIYWAKESFKWLYKHNLKVAQCFANDDSMSPLHEYIQTTCLNETVMVEATPMDVDEEPLEVKMAVDEEDYWGFPKEREPQDMPAQDDLSHWLTQLEQTLYQPPLAQQWNVIQAPEPVRFQRAQAQEDANTEIVRPSNPLRKSM